VRNSKKHINGNFICHKNPKYNIGDEGNSSTVHFPETHFLEVNILFVMLV